MSSPFCIDQARIQRNCFKCSTMRRDFLSYSFEVFSHKNFAHRFMSTAFMSASDTRFCNCLVDYKKFATTGSPLGQYNWKPRKRRPCAEVSPYCVLVLLRHR